MKQRFVGKQEIADKLGLSAAYLFRAIHTSKTYRELRRLLAAANYRRSQKMLTPAQSDILVRWFCIDIDDETINN